MFDTDAAVGVQPTPERSDATRPRVAIVTGYHKEDRVFLERCLRSVREQTIPADHIVVADGIPQDWLDAAGVRHIKLDRSHGDYGGTPRGVGALLAIAEDYDAIGFLDADNWLERGHVAHCLLAAASGTADVDYVIARRHMRRPDETILPVRDEPIEDHVDTNCFFFLAGAFHAIPAFALIPRALSPIGDRVFFAGLKRHNLRAVVLPEATVNYHCLWAALYRAAGENAPPEAKPNIDQGPIVQWLGRLSPPEKTVVARRTGFVVGVA